MNRMQVRRDSGSIARPWRVVWRDQTLVECESWDEAMSIARIVLKSGVTRM